MGWTLMSAKLIRMEDYVGKKKRNRLPFDEAEAMAAERAMDEFDRIAACMDEEKIDAYLLGTLSDSKYTG